MGEVFLLGTSKNSLGKENLEVTFCDKEQVIRGGFFFFDYRRQI